MHLGREDTGSDIVFVNADRTEQKFSFAARRGRIHALAGFLRARFQPGAAIGLLFPTSPDLVINWAACLVAGLRPLVLQYPTRKQRHAYWSAQISHTAKTVPLTAVIADSYCMELGMPAALRVVAQDELDALAPHDLGPIALRDFEILQLSSGTTGYRKAMRFREAELSRHVADFNSVLELQAGDRIVSWLPLSHDMGYIACFVMPLMLGIEVVMMDPMTWVADPGLLFDAIDRHRGTICYMPNFGFEVMARADSRPMPSMRRWISCSEPISAKTAERFLSRTGMPPESFSPCYAMAENIFAVSLGRGVRTAGIDGAEVVSCGAAIPGVEMKIVDGELWVRSPTSLTAYIDGADIRDAEGFYPTGDLGQIIAGEVYIAAAGRIC